MRKMTVTQQFSLLCFVSLVIFAIALGSIIGSSLEHNMLIRSQKTVASIVSEEVRKTFVGVNLITPKISSDFDVFAEKVKHLSLGPDIERIKFYNKDRVVVWSDEKKLVGQRFPDNKELDDAFNGEIASEISTLEKAENKYERQFKRLLELYVPIRLNASEEIKTVIEVYQNLDPLYEDISHQKQIVWYSTILGFALLYWLLFGIIWRASKQIQVQTKEIIQSEERYRGLVQSALDAIISVNSEGKVILFNKAAQQMFGYSDEEVIGQDPTMLMPGQYKSKHIVGISHFFRTGEITILGKTSEMEGLRRDGRTFPMELSLSGSGGEGSLAVTGIIRDITERKAMQEQLVAGERQSSISTVAGSIGHEINNVIGGLMGYADLLMTDPHDIELVRKSAEIFNAQSQRLKLHAHNLLSAYPLITIT
jgi:PAS domain S-box-containing protein